MAKRDKAQAKMIMPPPWPPSHTFSELGLKLIRTGLELLEQDYYGYKDAPPDQPMPMAKGEGTEGTG